MSDTSPTTFRSAAPVLKAVDGRDTVDTPATAADPKAAAVPGAVRPRPGVAKPGSRAGTAPAHKPQAVPSAPRPVVPAPTSARIRFRHGLLAASFVFCVLLPLAATVLYLYTRAAPQYHSETAFSVRSAEVGASGAASILGALTMVGGGGGASDTDILFDYIRSQEMVQAVDAKLDLRTIYNRPGSRDFVFSLGKAPSIEALTAYWNRMVSVAIDSQGGIIHVRANAFTPEDATAIADAILTESSALVNRLSDQAREDAIRFTRDELAETQENLKEQRAKIADFRRENRLVDPGADVAGQMGLLSAMQSELAKAMVERDQLLSFVGEDDQRVIQAGRRIDAIEKRIDAERSTLGAEGSDTTLTDVVGTYEELKVDLEFAQAAYTQALAAETAARVEARRQSRYLAPHVTPTTAEEALYPRRALIAGLALLFLSLGWGILMLLYYNVRDGRR